MRGWLTTLFFSHRNDRHLETADSRSHSISSCSNLLLPLRKHRKSAGLALAVHNEFINLVNILDSDPILTAMRRCSRSQGCSWNELNFGEDLGK
jgi:hypothetical protein